MGKSKKKSKKQSAAKPTAVPKAKTVKKAKVGSSKGRATAPAKVATKTDTLAPDEAVLNVGRRSIEAYSRLSYTMWHALAEFIDNSTQARENYARVMNRVLKDQPLLVEINHDRINKTLTIKDNSIGMSKAKLVAALQIAEPTPDSRGRSKYGMGMKTAACWIGKRWKVITTEYGSDERWTADVDVADIVANGSKIPLTPESVSPETHGTTIVISDLHRRIQTRTEENIRTYLGFMYRYDITDGKLKILYGTDEILPPEEMRYDTDPESKMYHRELPETKINGKTVRGSVGVLRKGARKFAGFSFYRNK
ncbi:MAG: ATP-binding protein, partial [Deltaproteobacteria bacterium]|nr:ATP-binding protein [Deltaproteobacteria bacterium]